MPKYFSIEHKERLSASKLGKPLSEEHIRNLSQSHRGQVPWNKNKKGEYKLWPNGRIFSEKHKENISKSKMGNKNHLGKHHTEEAKKKISDAHKKLELIGEKNLRWIKDRAQLARTRNIRGDSGESVVWARKVKTRDSWKCKIANNDCMGTLEIHHILAVRDFPELRYEINNGITLCHFHHPRKREEARRLVPFLRKLIINTY